MIGISPRWSSRKTPCFEVIGLFSRHAFGGHFLRPRQHRRSIGRLPSATRNEFPLLIDLLKPVPDPSQIGFPITHAGHRPGRTAVGLTSPTLFLAACSWTILCE